MPLSGVKVVEVGLNLAGPLAGAILADLGADVIKVERPETGDDARAWGPPFVDDTALPFHNMNRNKRSVVVNFKDAEEMQRLYQLIEQSDIFLHNLRPGVAEQVGLGAIGVPCAPILTIPEVLAQPQTKAMDIIRQVPGSALEVMNLPFSIDGQRPDFRSRAPKLGEHTDEVFKSKYTGK